jgi:alpha-ribazole phosphatase/probable phosphoglycerate mutase
MVVADLLRHGELEGGVKYRGHIEATLTVAGRKQMDDVWQNIANAVDVIISSPLSRCAIPAQAWAKQSGVDCIIDKRMIEMHYGDWEGLSHDEIEQRFPNMLEQWRKDPTGMCPPNGESSEALRLRVLDFWQDVTQKYQGKHVLIVGHSGSLRMLIACLRQKPIAYTRQLDMPYSCWYRAQNDAEYKMWDVRQMSAY